LVVSGWQLRVLPVGEGHGRNIAANLGKVLATKPSGEKPLAMLVVLSLVASDELVRFYVGVWLYPQLLAI